MSTVAVEFFLPYVVGCTILSVVISRSGGQNKRPVPPIHESSMEFRGYQEESDSCSSDTALVIGSDSGFESDVLKLRTKSLEVSNTRQGQSVLVAPCYTLLSSARPFSYNEAVTDPKSDELQPEIHTRLHDEIRDNPSKVSFAKGIFNLWVFFLIAQTMTGLYWDI